MKLCLLSDAEEIKVFETPVPFDYLESPVSDGTIEENFEEELINAPMGQLDSLAANCTDDELKVTENQLVLRYVNFDHSVIHYHYSIMGN